jgi:hypothetical protein
MFFSWCRSLPTSQMKNSPHLTFHNLPKQWIGQRSRIHQCNLWWAGRKHKLWANC